MGRGNVFGGGQVGPAVRPKRHRTGDAGAARTTDLPTDLDDQSIPANGGVIRCQRRAGRGRQDFALQRGAPLGRVRPRMGQTEQRGAERGPVLAVDLHTNGLTVHVVVDRRLVASDDASEGVGGDERDARHERVADKLPDQARLVGPGDRGEGPRGHRARVLGRVHALPVGICRAGPCRESRRDRRSCTVI